MKKNLLSILLVISMLCSFATSVYATPAVDLYGITPKEEQTEEKEEQTEEKEQKQKQKEQEFKAEKEKKLEVYIPTSQSNINVIVNGEKIIFPDQQPILLNDRTYVPVRFLVESLGAEVEWDNINNVVIIDNKGIQTTQRNNVYSRYYLKIGEPQIVHIEYSDIDNYPVAINIFDVPEYPILTDKGRTMLPFRFVAELLGAFVYYDDSIHSAIAEYDKNTKIQSTGAVPILSTVIQPYFLEELSNFRTENRPPHIKNPDLMKIQKNDELMAAATWKTLDLFKNYDHQNSDGTSTFRRFFQLYMSNKYGGQIPAFVNGYLENIAPADFKAKLGIQLINLKEDAKNMYYPAQKVDEVLDDSEYWYSFLQNEWGIKMVKLNEQSDLVYNGKSFSKYKMNSNYYMKVSGVNFHSFSIIRHWTADVYRSLAKQSIASWGASYGHRNALLQPMINVGYGVQLIDGIGNETFAAAGIY